MLFSMKKCFIHLVTLMCLLLCKVTADDEVKCEEIKAYQWSYTGMRQTCFLNVSYISWSGVTIAKADEAVGALWLEGNERVKALPVKVDVTFPHLFGYNANSCSVKSISKANFNSLKELEFLTLEHNQIETINRDTFEDLVSLQVLFLSHNKIKTMSAAVFRRLTKAHYISLYKNECVDEGFTSSRDIKRMFEVVSANCGFYDSEDVFNLSEDVKQTASANFEKLHQAQARQSEKLEAFVEQTIKEKEVIQSKSAEQLIRISRLEAQLKAAIEAKKAALAQIVLVKEIYGKLEAQWNSSCSRSS